MGIFGPHGYVAYTRGCRCEVCRKAKADYMRERRAAGRQAAQAYTQGRYEADIETHGTRYGYEEKGCRCKDCTRARTGTDAEYARRKRIREGVES